MSERDKKKSLSLDETVRLLGAEPPEAMQVVSLNPIALGALASSVGNRLTRDRGRPTDKSWDISRKVPMKKSNWDELAALSERLEVEKEIKVAPGQLAAIALESGIASFRKNASLRATSSSFVTVVEYKFSPDEYDEARALCAVAAEESYW